MDLSLWDRLLDSQQAHEERIDVAEPIDPEKFFEQQQKNGPALPLVIERKDDHLPFHSADKLQTGDTVILLTSNGNRQAVAEARRDIAEAEASRDPVSLVES